MYELVLTHLNLRQIADSGQCFRMQVTDTDSGTLLASVIAGERHVEAQQDGTHFTFSCEADEFGEFWSDYLDLSADYGDYRARTDPGDEYLQEAVRRGSGIRILRQDLWEMIVTFLISQNNNIPRIKGSIERLCRQLGRPLKTSGGRDFFGFPSPAAISEAGIETLKDMGLGYRDRYIWKAAANAADGQLDLERLKSSDYEEAHRLLMEQPGIGKKVADCICLFGLHKLEAFPIDTHIEKILKAHYEQGFPFDRYREFLGVIQQYLFYHDLKS